MRALTGPAAAALLQLDGFRDINWPSLWASPSTCRAAPGLIRTRLWLEPSMVEDLVVAHPVLVLRQLGDGLILKWPVFDKITPEERIELAVEHALRDGLVTLDELRIRSSRLVGDQMLHRVVLQRGDEPATESYAETRAVQVLRGWGLRCWRQLPVYESGRLKHRVDLVVPFNQKMRRPSRLLPSMGVLFEVDSREFHEGKFEEDHARQSTYDLLGYDWISFTPNQLEYQQARSRRSLEAKLKRTTQLRKQPKSALKCQLCSARPRS
jgi:hypothetical protein